MKIPRFPKPTIGNRKPQTSLRESIPPTPLIEKLNDDIQISPTSLADSSKHGRLAEFTNREIVRIPLDLVDKSPYQNRSKLDENYISDLAENIQIDGLNNPITVRIKQDDRYELLAGDNRQEAARLLGWTEIDAEVRNVDDNTAARLVFFDNYFHKPLSDYEIYKGFSNLMVLGASAGAAPSQRSLAKEAGVSPAQMTRLFSFAKLPEKVRAILDDIPCILQANAAESLVRFCDPSHEHFVVEAIEQLRDGKLTQGRAAAWIEHRVCSRPTKSERTLTSSDGKQFAKLERVGQRLTVKIATGIDSAKIEEVVFLILRQHVGNGLT
ncbi:MAG: ParB/RepB/Spo0J family partition protein [Nitrosospira sp.]